MTVSDFRKAASRLASGKVRTAGRIEFVRDQGPLRRDVRVQGFRWDPEIHRNLAKTLWAVERSQSYGMAALRLFSKMKSSDFSPDGLLGGRGYIQQVKDMRSGLSQAAEVLSSFSDTLYDEVNADHWKAAMSSDPSTEKIVEEAEQAQGESYVEDQFRQEVPSAEEGLGAESHGDPEPETYENPNPEDFNPFFEKPEEDDSAWDWDSMKVSSDGPSLPTDGSPQKEGLSSDVEVVMDTTGKASRGNYAGAISRMLESVGRTAAFRRSGDPSRLADSSIDPATLPGPRVMHIGPAESPEEFGYFTENGEVPSDDPMGEGFSQLDRIYEDECADGTTGYSYPTQGDETTFRPAAARLANGRATYSWLPGSRNEKIMPYYDFGVTDEDVSWMRENDSPNPPVGTVSKPIRPRIDPLWSL